MTYRCFWKTTSHTDKDTGKPIPIDRCRPCRGEFDHFPLELDCGFTPLEEHLNKIERLKHLDRDSEVQK